MKSRGVFLLLCKLTNTFEFGSRSRTVKCLLRLQCLAVPLDPCGRVHWSRMAKIWEHWLGGDGRGWGEALQLGKLKRKGFCNPFFPLGFRCLTVTSSLSPFFPASLCAHTFPYGHTFGWSSSLCVVLLSSLPRAPSRCSQGYVLNWIPRGAAFRNACLLCPARFTMPW